jgi:hypothetical protein
MILQDADTDTYTGTRTSTLEQDKDMDRRIKVLRFVLLYLAMLCCILLQTDRQTDMMS